MYYLNLNLQSTRIIHNYLIIYLPIIIRNIFLLEALKSPITIITIILTKDFSLEPSSCNLSAALQ